MRGHTKQGTTHRHTHRGVYRVAPQLNMDDYQKKSTTDKIKAYRKLLLFRGLGKMLGVTDSEISTLTNESLNWHEWFLVLFIK